MYCCPRCQTPYLKVELTVCGKPYTDYHHQCACDILIDVGETEGYYQVRKNIAYEG